MDKALLDAFQATDYRVRLARGGWATIRIDTPLPAALQALVGTQSWGFITAWNPHARLRHRSGNRMAQRRLLAELRALPSAVTIRPALGVGADWREPSLFVVGPGTAALDTLARNHAQRAYLHGHASGNARLRLLE